MSTQWLRTVLQLVELKEFAEQHKLDYKSNEAVDLWIKEGHAEKFDRHYEAVKSDIEQHCYACCGSQCRGEPERCPLRKKLHKLMKDSRDW